VIAAVVHGRAEVHERARLALRVAGAVEALVGLAIATLRALEPAVARVDRAEVLEGEAAHAVARVQLQRLLEQRRRLVELAPRLPDVRLRVQGLGVEIGEAAAPGMLGTQPRRLQGRIPLALRAVDGGQPPQRLGKRRRLAGAVGGLLEAVPGPVQ
jgi:hypothetical protein